MRLTHLKFILTWILAVGLLSAAEYARIRLCGWRLAEVLEIVCKEYGGFHSPHERSSRNVTADIKRGSHEKRPRSITQRGIADECCKKKCSFLTLVSYCAYSIGKESDFHQMLDSRITSELIAHGYVDHGNIQKDSSEETGIELYNSMSYNPLEDISDDPESTNEPNLGTYVRNKPFFLMFNPLQEENEFQTEYSI